MMYFKRLTLAAVIAFGTAAAGGLEPDVAAATNILRVSPEVRRLIAWLRLVDIPRPRRKHNWIGDRGQGSCVHAALVNLWHWQGRHELAEWWAARHGNGETAEGLAA